MIPQSDIRNIGISAHIDAGRIQGKLISRRALLLGSETRNDYSVIHAEVTLAKMFGYSN